MSLNNGCDDEPGKQAVYVTTDNALTWTKRSIPHATQGDAGHPSLGVGKDGTGYAAWGSADNDGKNGRVHVSVSRTPRLQARLRRRLAPVRRPHLRPRPHLEDL